MEYRDNFYELLVKGDCNDTDYSTKVFFIPIEEERLAEYLFNRFKKLKKKNLEEVKWKEGEEDFLVPFLPEDQFGSCWKIVDTMMSKVKDGHYSIVKPTDVPEVDFEEFSDIYDVYDYSWSD